MIKYRVEGTAEFMMLKQIFKERIDIVQLTKLVFSILKTNINHLSLTINHYNNA